MYGLRVQRQWMDIVKCLHARWCPPTSTTRACCIREDLLWLENHNMGLLSELVCLGANRLCGTVRGLASYAFVHARRCVCCICAFVKVGKQPSCEHTSSLARCHIITNHSCWFVPVGARGPPGLCVEVDAHCVGGLCVHVSCIYTSTHQIVCACESRWQHCVSACMMFESLLMHAPVCRIVVWCGCAATSLSRA